MVVEYAVLEPHFLAGHADAYFFDRADHNAGIDPLVGGSKFILMVLEQQLEFSVSLSMYKDPT